MFNLSSSFFCSISLPLSSIYFIGGDEGEAFAYEGRGWEKAEEVRLCAVC